MGLRGVEDGSGSAMGEGEGDGVGWGGSEGGRPGASLRLLGLRGLGLGMVVVIGDVALWRGLGIGESGMVRK